MLFVFYTLTTVRGVRVFPYRSSSSNMSVSRQHSAKLRQPLVSELETSHLRSVAKTSSLCLNLEETHRRTWQPTSALFPMTKGCSRRIREAQDFCATGSYFVDRLPIPDLHPQRFTEVTKSRDYVDRFIDSWTRSGSPQMWEHTDWSERVRSASRQGGRR